MLLTNQLPVKVQVVYVTWLRPISLLKTAAVDFLGKQKFVDRERIGAIGICGLGSHVLTAATIDVRIKVVATSVMYDMSDSMWKGLNNTKTEEQRELEKDYLAKMRWQEVDEGPVGGPHELASDENNKPI